MSVLECSRRVLRCRRMRVATHFVLGATRHADVEHVFPPGGIRQAE